MKELLAIIALIAGFSVTGLFVDADKQVLPGPISFVFEESPHGVPLAVNPVVRISVPTHNIFAPH